MLYVILLNNSDKQCSSTIVNILKKQIDTSIRRIIKGINVGYETLRFHQSCDGLEFFATKLSTKENTYILSKESESIILSQLFSVNKVPYILKKDFELLKLNNDILDEFECGILLNKPFSKIEISSVKNKEELSYCDYGGFDMSIFDEVEKTYGEKDKQEKYLLQKIKYALENKKPIGKYFLKNEGEIEYSKIRHKVITKVIRSISYSKQKIDNEIYVKYGYNDGSVGGKILLFQLEEKDKPQSIKEYNVCLISNRHFEIDTDIDFCFLRNSEINTGNLTYSEQEDIAYKKVYSQLKEILNRYNNIKINLHHTGLEPAIIGTYRAIVEIKLNYEESYISIVPYIGMNFTLLNWD